MKVFTREENQAWSKTLPGKMCTACVAIVHNDSVLMVKAGYKDYWSFPAGTVDEAESPKQAAIRECYEEVGLHLSEEHTNLLATVYTTGKAGDRDRFNIGFIARIDTPPTEFTVPNDEIEAVEWVPFDQIAQRANNKPSYIEFQAEITTADAARRHYIEL